MFNFISLNQKNYNLLHYLKENTNSFRTTTRNFHVNVFQYQVINVIFIYLHLL